jgi:hypothetical protein
MPDATRLRILRFEKCEELMLSEFEKGISLAVVQLLQLKNILIKRRCLFDVPHLEGNVVAAVDLNLHE